MITLHRDEVIIPVTQYAIDMMNKALQETESKHYTLPMKTERGKDIDVTFKKIDIGFNNEPTS